MSEQEPVQTASQPMPGPENYKAWNEFWTKEYKQPWRTEPEISKERQDELSWRRDTIIPDIQRGIYPFKGVKFSRADVEWLLAMHENGQGPVNWDDPTQRQRMGLDLRGANLAGIKLRNLPLARLHGGLAFSERLHATSEQVALAAMHLEEADLVYARLEGAWLWGAHLEGAICRHAYLEGAILNDAYLAGANLKEVFLDASTTLVAASLSESEKKNSKYGDVSFVDVRWGGVNLALINWAQLKMLGDERRARAARNRDGMRKERSDRLYEYEQAVRANLQLAVALRTQGINQEADRFTYRAQVLQRQVLRRQRSLGGYFFSLLLAMLAGYGYRIGRILVAYIFIVGIFTAAFLVSDVVSGQATLTVPHALDALQISLNAIHGRVFFAQFSLDTLQSWLATAESIIGIVIEGVFVAMLIQRFFAR